MELFEIIPANLFTLLTSKNREVYAQGLLILRKIFLHDVQIEKTKLATQISHELQNCLLDLGANEEDGISLDDLKDINSRSKTLVRKFIETGWLETEFAKGSKLIEFCSLPPYSVSLLEVLNSLCSEEIKEYDAFMYTMYSSLKNANDEYADYRFASLCTVYDKIIEFEQALKQLFTNLRRHYSRMSHLKTVNQVLHEHFDSYQRDVVKQFYLPLKTKDSLSRFRGPIMSIINSWMKDEEIMEDIYSQAIVTKHFTSKDEAINEVIQKVNFITDKLISLQDLLSEIDDKNNEYVQTATDKMRFLLNSDKSIKAKLNKLIAKLAADRFDNIPDSFNLVSEYITLESQDILTEDSLFVRKDAERDDVFDPVIIEPFDDDIANNALDRLDDSLHSPYSYEGIERFMRIQMDEMDKINSNDIPVNEVNDMIMVMYSFIRGFNSQAFYKVDLNKGYTKHKDYGIPDVDFVRRKKENVD